MKVIKPCAVERIDFDALVMQCTKRDYKKDRCLVKQIKKEQLNEVKTQLMKNQINTMFRENLSAKMKEISSSEILFLL